MGQNRGLSPVFLIDQNRGLSPVFPSCRTYLMGVDGQKPWSVPCFCVSVLVDALLHRFSWLLENQTLWRVRPDIAEHIHCYPEQSHVIYFRTLDSDKGGLEILRVLHVRMDPSEHF